VDVLTRAKEAEGRCGLVRDIGSRLSHGGPLEKVIMTETTRLINRLLRTTALIALLTLGASGPAMATGSRSANSYDLSTGPTFQSGGDRIHRNVTYTFTIVNGSSRDVLIRRVGQSGPGLKLLIPSGWEDTRTIRPHKSISETVKFHVSNCAKVPKGTWPLTMDASWNTGTWQRVSLQLTTAGPLQWQKFIADSVCP
jgi:hypothetical protein